MSESPVDKRASASPQEPVAWQNKFNPYNVIPAKRIFINGIEGTGLSLEGLLAAGNKEIAEEYTIPLYATAPDALDARLPIVPWNDGWAIRPCHTAADAFWQYWRENGETHKHGYYESTWGAINRALAAAVIGDRHSDAALASEPHKETK